MTSKYPNNLKPEEYCRILALTFIYIGIYMLSIYIVAQNSSSNQTFQNAINFTFSIQTLSLIFTSIIDILAVLIMFLFPVLFVFIMINNMYHIYGVIMNIQSLILEFNRIDKKIRTLWKLCDSPQEYMNTIVYIARTNRNRQDAEKALDNYISFKESCIQYDNQKIITKGVTNETK